MNRAVIPLIMLSSGCLVLFAQNHAPNTEQQILQTEHRWVQSAVHGDVDNMASFMSDKWIALFSDGTTMDKATWVQQMRAGEIKFSKVEFNDEQVIVHGGIAIFVGRFTEKGVWDGKDFEETGTEMSTFLKVNNRWEAISSAFGHPKPAEE